MSPETLSSSRTTVERVLALRSVAAFRGVPTEQLAWLASAARERALAEGDVLFSEGDPPESLYVLLEGEVQLERQGRPAGAFRAIEPIGAWSTRA